jgi:Type II secretion system (T2SS), protein M subtype b
MITSSALSRLSGGDRRTLAVGATVIAGLVLLAKGGPAWRVWQQDTAAGATELAADALRSDAEIAAYPALHDSLRERAARLRSLTPSVLPGDDPASAAATLATIISDAASDAGVKLGTVQPRVDSEPHSLGGDRTAPPPTFARVSARADAAGDVVALTQFLADLEHGPALLWVRELSITQPDPAAPSSRIETLHAELTVAGLALNHGRVKGRRDSVAAGSVAQGHS